MNNCVFIGHLGADPELRRLQGGLSVASVSLAVRDSWKKGDKWEERTDWIRVVAWGKLADRVEAFQKGDMVLVHGKLRERSWKDKEGKDRRAHEIEARVFQKIQKPPKGEDMPEPTPEDAPPYAGSSGGGEVPPPASNDPVPF